MKLKHRLVGVGIVAVLVVFVYLLLSDDILPEINLKTRGLSEFTSSRKGASRLESCDFAARQIPESGIHTHTLFDNVPVDDGQQPLRFSNERDTKSPKPVQEEEPLRVFVIPHSHNDPGWLKTLNRYYVEQTKEILDNMVTKLTKYEDMTFVWSETVFLSLWYRDISDQTKVQFKKLIERGQLELVTGGWVDPDEAITHYVDIIDEMMEGHRWLEKNVGVKPEVYWAPDPFGYSSTMPYLTNRAGFKRMVILRIHDDVKAQLRERQNLEFFWRQNWDRNDRNTDMFTHLLPYILYSIKHSCGPDPYVCLMFDFRQIPGELSEAAPPILNDGNIEAYAKNLLDQFRAKAQHYRQNVVFMPLGDDFRYDRDIEWDQQYKNYKLLFDYMNKQKEWNVKASFGTPSDYFKTLDSESEYRRKTSESSAVSVMPEYPVLYGDFYPYMDRDEEFWTGFYTTRPFWKGLSRELQADIRSAEILHSLACAYAKYKLSNFRALLSNLALLDSARKSLALFQHHDGITGTSKPDVVLDYGERMWKAKRSVQRVKLTAAAYLLSDGTVQMNSTVADGKKNVRSYVIDVDDARNSETLKPTKTTIRTSVDGVKVIFFNSVAHTRREIVRLRVDSRNVIVTGHEGNPVRSQILPLWKNRLVVDENDYVLVFLAEMQGFAMRTYIVKRVREKLMAQFVGKGLATVSVLSGTNTNSVWPKTEAFDLNAITIKNDYFTADFDREWGLLYALKYPKKDVRTAIRFFSYTSSRSGAYLFYPTGKAGERMFTRDPGVSPSITVIRGPVTSEVRVSWEFLTHTARVYHSTIPQARAVELMNEFDISQDSNTFTEQEIIMRLHTDVHSKHEFYTDLNGYQMRKRKYREKFHVAGNYYPMTTMSYLQDNFTRVSLLSSQSHGVSSLKSGQLEVMLDRKLSFDDNRGLGEGIYDNLPTTVRFLLLVESGALPEQVEMKNSYPSMLAHELSNQLLYPLTTFYQIVHDAPFTPIFTPLAMDLPCDVHLVNLKTMYSPRDQNSLDVALILHRLVYQCQYVSKGRTCTTELNQVSFANMFKHLRVSGVKERSLTLMYPKKDLSPYSLIAIEPMDINSYLLTFK